MSITTEILVAAWQRAEDARQSVENLRWEPSRIVGLAISAENDLAAEHARLELAYQMQAK